ncbi:urease accessory protein UreF [Clostridium akagii]|uniref:urease accessory protein UreF n=1 Tax=Clostridium akagii TaxID=91623 RepID=UPI00068E5E31|nr:urease accessory protein UreF [Clostridium akagii]
MSTKDQFFTMLQISDSVFPIGSYTQSNGLETYVQKGIIKDKKSAEEYLKSVLWNSYMYGDFLAVKLAYEYTNNNDMKKIIELDEILWAVKASREMKEGSSKLCIRFIKLIEKFYKEKFIIEYGDTIKSGECMGQHSIVYGSFSALAKIPKENALRSYLYNAASSVVNNCAKLIPLGQVDGQEILFGVQELLQKMTIEIEKLSIDDIGRCCISFDIRAMEHEELYSRLYMS